MKKLLLLLIAVTALSCSGDDSSSVSNQYTLSIEFESRFCPSDTECIERHRVKNTSDTWYSFDIKYTFNRVDSHYGDATYTEGAFAEGEVDGLYSVTVDYETEVLSAEIVNIQEQ